jgi:hypothetical protein
MVSTETPNLSQTTRYPAKATAWSRVLTYYNFPETPSEGVNVLPESSYRRLREIKARYDLDQTIVSPHPCVCRSQ